MGQGYNRHFIKWDKVFDCMYDYNVLNIIKEGVYNNHSVNMNGLTNMTCHIHNSSGTGVYQS